MSTSHPITTEKINASFSGHETFPCRYTWLKKGVDTVRDDSTIFADDSATITLGVGKNMVRSIRHWCQVAGLIKGDGVDLDHRRQFVSTDLAIESLPMTDSIRILRMWRRLWLIHWNLTPNANRATTWFWAFSIFGQNEFRKDKFISELINWAEKSTRNRISEIRLNGMSIVFFGRMSFSLNKNHDYGRYLRLSTRRIGIDFRFA